MVLVDGGEWDGRMVEVRRVGEWMDGWMNEWGSWCDVLLKV